MFVNLTKGSFLFELLKGMYPFDGTFLPIDKMLINMGSKKGLVVSEKSTDTMRKKHKEPSNLFKENSLVNIQRQGLTTEAANQEAAMFQKSLPEIQTL